MDCSCYSQYDDDTLTAPCECKECSAFFENPVQWCSDHHDPNRDGCCCTMDYECWDGCTCLEVPV